MKDRDSKEYTQLALTQACSTAATLLSLTFVISHLLKPIQRKSISVLLKSIVEDINDKPSFLEKIAGDNPDKIGEEDLKLALSVFELCICTVAESVDFPIDDNDHSIYEIAKDLGPALLRLIASLNPN